MGNPHLIPLGIPHWGGDRMGLSSFESPILVLGSLVPLLGYKFFHWGPVPLLGWG